jgi:hypothetical protein
MAIGCRQRGFYMNQKLFFGIICIASIAGIFVACGEGE